VLDGILFFSFDLRTKVCKLSHNSKHAHTVF